MNNYTVLASVTADGVKTIGELLTELYTITGDISDPKAFIKYNNSIHRIQNINLFSIMTSNNTGAYIYTIKLDDASRVYWKLNGDGAEYTDQSGNIMPANQTILLCK